MWGGGGAGLTGGGSNRWFRWFWWMAVTGSQYVGGGEGAGYSSQVLHIDIRSRWWCGQ